MSLPENRLTVRSEADLVAALPYLLGFRPDDGSVVVMVNRNGRIVFTARADLPAPGAPVHQLLDLAAHLVPVVRRQQPITDVILTGYGNPDHVDAALRTIGEAVTASGVTVREMLRVTGTRVVNLTCEKPACCPPQGMPFDPTASLVAVQATAAGLVALPDRAAVAARFAPVAGAARDAVQRATDDALAWLEAVTAAGTNAVDAVGAQTVRDALRQPDKRLSDGEAAWLTVLLTRTSVRDLAVDLTEPTDQHVTFWAEVTRRAHDTLVPAPATLLALTAWRCGDGVLATMAAEHALQADPRYHLAHLLRQALHAGLPPSTFEQATGSTRTNPTTP
ncbi:hypothetical protein AWW66_23670 [Micromonospora rosaria]|uniref:DUF4192 domain-containing protein n=1 Tax=Micromonospora rosaria TaxID=47874 RepID=A0A136PM98_9ACTN|nr:DUF4192 domain-containing protein [Micromonospora rosaria]KXK59543.1 hypothetical protein AWW66_23670 [Micromonospora rosaria]